MKNIYTKEKLNLALDYAKKYEGKSLSLMDLIKAFFAGIESQNKETEGKEKE